MKVRLKEAVLCPLLTHRLLAAVGKLDGVGALNIATIGVLIVAKVRSGVVILHTVREVVRNGFLWR